MEKEAEKLEEGQRMKRRNEECRKMILRTKRSNQRKETR
jgi:hypothetical protein